MYCDNLFFSEHALTKMAKRGIEPEDVETVIKQGEIIRSYPDDVPEPSYLMMGKVKGYVLHVVISKDVLYENCIVVTTYLPDLSIWEADFKTKKARL